MHRVRIHPQAKTTEPPVDATKALLERAQALPESLVIVLGGDTPPSWRGRPQPAVQMTRTLAPVEVRKLENEWRQGEDGLGGADHIVWAGDLALAHAEHAPEYYAFILGHEFEHARTAERDLDTAALETLVEEVATETLHEDLPHELHCDVAGLAFARERFGQDRVDECLERLGAVDGLDADRQRWFSRLRKLLLGLDVRGAMLSFIVSHDLSKKALGYRGCTDPVSRHIDWERLERELQPANSAESPVERGWGERDAVTSNRHRA